MNHHQTSKFVSSNSIKGCFIPSCATASAKGLMNCQGLSTGAPGEVEIQTQARFSITIKYNIPRNFPMVLCVWESLGANGSGSKLHDETLGRGDSELAKQASSSYATQVYPNIRLYVVGYGQTVSLNWQRVSMGVNWYFDNRIYWTNAYTIRPGHNPECK
jgi:hypothetical protein